MKYLLKIIIVIMEILILLMACSQTKKQRVLSFFFDGVESPDSTRSGETFRSGDDSDSTDFNRLSRTNPTYFYHAIYQDKECNACHDSENANQLIEELPDLCYQCHTDYSEEYENLHVPVAMGECGECHHPHLAKYEKLLTAQIQSLCFACHAEEDIRVSETHSEIGETSCTDCHNPHGSENEYLFN